jgi:hypothetical protein
LVDTYGSPHLWGVRVQVPGAHTASYSMGTRDSFPGDRGLKLTTRSPPTSVEVNKTWICTSIPPYVFTA